MAKEFPSTLLVRTNDPEEIQKADLDLLKKINILQDQITALDTGSSLMLTSFTTMAESLAAVGVYDSGANANGRWVRFNDGTMLCAHTLNLGTATQTWTFPQVFITPPSVQATMVSAAAVLATTNNLSAASVDVLGWTTLFILASTGARTVFAMGAWK